MATCGSRLMAPLIAFVAFASFSVQSHALLDESEEVALKSAIESVKRAKTVGAYVTTIKNKIPMERSLFLKNKSRNSASHQLPKVEQKSANRILVSSGNHRTTVEFVSLRSELMVINKIEVEFLPKDSQDVRWGKIVKAVQAGSSKTVGIPAWKWLLPESQAQYRRRGEERIPSREDDPNVHEVVTQSIARVVYGIQSQAADEQGCARIDVRALEICRDEIEDYLPPVTPGQGGLATDLENPRYDQTGPASERVRNSNQNQVNRMGFNGREAHTAQLNAQGQLCKQVPPKVPASNAQGELSTEERARIHREGRQIPYIKSRITQLTDMVRESRAQGSCSTKVEECLNSYFARLRFEIQSEDLDCYIHHHGRLPTNESPPGNRTGAPN